MFRVVHHRLPDTIKNVVQCSLRRIWTVVAGKFNTPDVLAFHTVQGYAEEDVCDVGLWCYRSC